MEPIPSSPTDILSGRDIIILSLSNWDGPRRIRHYLTEELVRRGNRVLFVEANFTLTKFLRSWNWGRFVRFLSGAREKGKNLFLISAPPFFPGGEFFATISRLNWAMTRMFLDKAIQTLEFKNPVLWIYAYNASSLVGKFNEQIALYLCNDAFALLHHQPFLQQRVRSLEAKLLEKVDVTISLSEKLTEANRLFTRRAETIHHGVDVKHFDRVLSGSPKIPNDLVGIPRPIIGYSGVIRYMVDLDLIETIARSRPEWSLVFVGPIDESAPSFYQRVEELKCLPSVHFVGPKPPEEIPLYLNAFDVCILPYVQSELMTYYAVPLKFYEYLAAGKPVVWSIGQRPFPEHILINAQNPGEFEAAIDRALTLCDIHHTDDRKKIAHQNGWEHRITQISAILQGVLDDQTRSSDFPSAR